MAESALKISETDGVTVVSFTDASVLDILTIQKIGRQLYGLVEEQGRRKIILDFAEVRFLSSQALGVLLTLRRKAEKAGAQVLLCRIRAELARVFRITNLDNMFAFFQTRADALAHFGVAPAADAD